MQEIMEGGNLCLKQCETTTNEKEPLYVRVMRKKYKCILLWLFSIASVSQLLYIIIDKFDNKFLEDLIEKTFNSSKNGNLCESPSNTMI